MHVCIDDHSRVAFAKIMADEKRRSAIAFLKAALAYYASLGSYRPGCIDTTGIGPTRVSMIKHPSADSA